MSDLCPVLITKHPTNHLFTELESQFGLSSFYFLEVCESYIYVS